MNRRGFLAVSAGAAALASFGPRVAWSAGAEARIEVLLDEKIGVIAPEVYGHFAEHLGGVVYDGIWVGEKSRIPNEGGVRTALVEKLRQIHAPVVRWPGGCFADSYDWRDGIGPRPQRPTRTNFWEVARNYEGRSLDLVGAQTFETNAFGTDEFMHFCKLAGAQPYVAANLRSLTPLDFDRWVEYCNAPTGSSTLARARAANGSSAPYGVKYWGVGNESWGCGGNFEPEEYAEEFRKFTTWVPHYGVPLNYIGSGPNDNALDWTRGFFEALKRKGFMPRELTGWSVHHYTWNLSRGRTRDWFQGKGDALNFNAVDWYETFREAVVTEKIITDQWTLMGGYDPERRIKLVVDEYGAWYTPGSELDPTHLLGQQITMRDAVVTALTLDIFNRHADKVSMAASAQLINCLNALFFAHEDKFIVTPVFHVFDMYAAHQGAEAVRINVEAPGIDYDRDGKSAAFSGLAGSASLRGKALTVTCANPSATAARSLQVALRGASTAVVSVYGVVLANGDIRAHNSFAEPNAVTTAPLNVSSDADGLHATLPAGSVARITATLV